MKIINIVLRAIQGGGGANAAICPGPQLKGAPNFAKRGAPKSVIKKNYLERFLYK